MKSCIDQVLDRLNGVKERSKTEWQAICPAHSDKDPSLSIRLVGDKILLHCHAGCSVESICAALDLEMSALFLDKPKPDSKIASTYDYQNEKGVLLYQVVRKDPKGFFQRRPDGRGGWITNLSETRRVLYKLPQIIEADPDSIVYIVEGEKDADLLWSLGCVATTNPGGAGSWRDEYTAFLAERDVIVIPDNDPAGKEHAYRVAESLQGVTKSISTVTLAGLPKKGDVSDWLDSGHLAEELPDLAKEFGADSISIMDVSGADSISTTEQQYHLTDTGNAQRFANHHQSSARYCHPWSKWFIFDGIRWREDATEAVYQLVTDSIRDLWHEAGSATDSSDRTKIGQWARTSESAQRIRAAEQLARSQPGISAQPAVLDTDKWKLNVLNGTVDLRTGKLLPHNREDLITKLAPISFDSKAECPKWTCFLERILNDNKELCAYLQRAVGYALTGDVSEQVMFFLYGTGANGKSTFLETIRAMLGDSLFSLEDEHERVSH